MITLSTYINKYTTKSMIKMIKTLYLNHKNLKFDSPYIRIDKFYFKIST